MNALDSARPTTLAELRRSGWTSRPVKDEVRRNFLCMLQSGEPLFPGIVGYDDTVIPEINIALLAGHDMLFLGEKGQAKSRLMRSLVRFLDEWTPYIDAAECPVHEDPFNPITRPGKRLVESRDEKDVPIAWLHRNTDVLSREDEEMLCHFRIRVAERRKGEVMQRFRGRLDPVAEPAAT